MILDTIQYHLDYQCLKYKIKIFFTDTSLIKSMQIMNLNTLILKMKRALHKSISLLKNLELSNLN